MLMLKQERLKREWTQQQVADYCGVSKVTIHAIETGKAHPSYPVLCKLEDLFHRSHRHLLAQMPEEPTISGKV